MNLVIDNGNTSLKAGLFDKGELVFNHSYLPEHADALITDLRNHEVNHIVLSSVAAIPSFIESYISTLNNVLIVEAKTPLPIINKYLSPQTLGIDRLSNAVGAAVLFPKKNCLVIDAGTCLKFDFINDANEYQGGSIAPGLQMRYRALHEFTDRLPLLHPAEEIELIGKNTEGSIHSGVINGMTAEINAIISEYKSRYDTLQIILTGGDARFFLNRIKTHIFADPILTLKGLDAILRYNQ